jgi:hypothetical protein
MYIGTGLVLNSTVIIGAELVLYMLLNNKMYIGTGLVLNSTVIILILAKAILGFMNTIALAYWKV